jgi:hypothetical protein
MALQRRKVDGVEITDVDLFDDVTVDTNAEEKKKPKKRPKWLTKAFADGMLHDFKNEHTTLTGLAFLERFGEVVALHYFTDPCNAGVHTACLSCQPGDPKLYYASVLRYHRGGGQGKEVVCGEKGASLEEALRNLAGVWFEVLKTEGPDGSTTKGAIFDPVLGKTRSREELGEEFDNDLTRKLYESLKKKGLING